MEDIKNLILKDIKLEWRSRHALNGMLLYVISTVFMCYMSFKLKTDSIEPITWNTLFWLISLFSAVNSVSRSFSQENATRYIYFYQLTHPSKLILSKIFYNFLLLTVLGLLGLAIYIFLMGNHIQNPILYVLSVILGSLGFSSTLTLVSGIAAKAENSSSLMAILSFPIILPMLSMLIKLSKNAMDGLTLSVSYDELLVIIGIDFIVIALSYLLFPFIWKS